MVALVAFVDEPWPPFPLVVVVVVVVVVVILAALALAATTRSDVPLDVSVGSVVLG